MVVRKALIEVEPYVCATATIAGLIAVDVAAYVGECKVAEFHAGVVGSIGCAGASLIDVRLVVISCCARFSLDKDVAYLRNEEREGHVVELHISP